MFESVQNWWNATVEKHGDPRVNEWMMCSNPIPVLILIGIYLLLVYKCVPKFMENRPAYQLKTYIICYNLFQIIASASLMYAVITSGWTTYYSWGCQPVDYSNHPLAIRMIRTVWYGILLKLIEMSETIVFVLRKKQNQISKLHVYHHASTLFFGWIACRFIGGGMFSFTGIINSFIHVLMYTYYLLSALGPSWQKRISKWKSTLTILQMVQFTMILMHSAIGLSPNCDVPKQVLLLYVPNIVLIFAMFGNFYKQNYIKKQLKTKTK